MLVTILLQFIPKCSIDNKSAFVQIMAWRHTGDMPLFKPVMTYLLTYICVIRLQWVKSLSIYRWQFSRLLIWWPIALQNCTYRPLTHWGRVMHICVGKLTIIGSDNGLSPGRRQAIIWTNAAILLIGPLGTNFSEILIGIQTFSFMKMHLKMSSAKWRPFCLGLNELNLTFSLVSCSLTVFNISIVPAIVIPPSRTSQVNIVVVAYVVS